MENIRKLLRDNDSKNPFIKRANGSHELTGNFLKDLKKALKNSL